MITLNEKSWHRNLQKYVFGNEVPLFKTFCPYFWLTILAVIIVPMVALLKHVFVPALVRVGKFCEAVSTSLDKYRFARYTEAQLFMLFLRANNRLLKWDDRYVAERRLGKILYLREELGMEKAEEVLSKFRAKLLELVAGNKRTSAEESKLALEKRLESLAKGTKLFFTGLSVVAGLALVYQLVVWLLTVGAGDWKKFLTTALFVISALLVGFLVVVLFAKILNAGPVKTALEKTKALIIKSVTTTCKKVKAAWDFLMDKYCPLVKWEK